MIKFLSSKNRRGFTLPEIIAGALIVSISAGGTYSAYLISRRFAERFKHRTWATNRAIQVMDRVRYRNSYDDDGAGQALQAGSHNISTAGWDLPAEVDNLQATYTVSNVWFSAAGTESAADPGTGTPPFKRIEVSIQWDERE